VTNWNELAGDESFSGRGMVLGTETATPALEVAMDETTTVETTAPNKEDAMSKKRTTKPKATTARGANASKAKPKAAKAKAPKPKRESGPKPDRTFAIRITGQELAAIHKASGPRSATKFVRAVAAAFAQGDTKAFARILEEAVQARG